MQINKFLKKYLGFTLPEVLLTVTIIGVISLITIPPLVTSIQNHQYKTGAKKAHTLVSESLDSMKIDVDNIYKTYNNDNIKPTNLRNLYAKYFGLKSVYPADAFDEMYHPLNNTSINVNKDIYNGGGFQARNGMMILIGRIPKPYESGQKALVISVDIDGSKKGDNQLGKDIFSFEIMPNDNLLPIGAQSSIDIGKTSFKSKDYCLTNTAGNDLNGIACAYSAVHEAEYMGGFADRASEGQNCNGQWNAQTKTCQCFYGKIWENKKCVCPAGFLEKNSLCYDTNDGETVLLPGGDTATCRENEHKYFDITSLQCQCVKGYKKIGIKCEFDNENTLEDGTFCENGKIDEKTCKCINNQEWVVPEGKVGLCIDKCPVGTLRVKGSTDCECDSQFDLVLVGTQCCPRQKGKATLITGEAALGCNYECDASKGLVYNKGEDCECIKGLDEDDDGNCVCPMEFATLNANGQCECNASRVMDGDDCKCKNGRTTPDPNCGCDSTKGLIASASGSECECDVSAGYASGSPSGDNSCECDSSRNYQKVDGKCVCKEGYVAGVDGCKCDEGNNWVATTGGGCECPVGNGFTRDGRECRCDGTVKYQGNTQICDGNCANGAKWNKSLHKCECDLTNAKLDESGKNCECQIDGMTVQYKGAGKYLCECPTGYKVKTKPNSAEQYCAVAKEGANPCQERGQKWDGTICACQDGTIPGPKGCTCPEGFLADDTLNTTLDKETYEQTATYYAKLYCIHSGCVGEDSLGTWHGEGGENGKCECDPGLSFNGSECVCNDIDALRKPNKETQENSCICQTEKLKYKNVDDKWQCVPDNENNIYELGSASDLVNATNLLGSYNFKLNTDVTYKDWTPWGTQLNPFNGTFDGNGKDIEIDTIKGESYVGFFGYTGIGCKISNLNLVVNNVIGKVVVGALVGQNNCEIENVTVTILDNVEGEFVVGGFVGYNDKYGKIRTSIVDSGNIIAKIPASGGDDDTTLSSNSGFVAGGFVGNNDMGIIEYCSVDSLSVIAEHSIMGGFVGSNSGIIKTSSVGENVTVGLNNQGAVAGGFVGKQPKPLSSIMNYTEISNCYNRAVSVSAKEYVGGFIGNFETGNITRIYSTTDTTNTSNLLIPAGSFAGDASTDINIFESFVINNKQASILPFGNNINGKFTDLLEKSGLTVQTADNLKLPTTFICNNWEKNNWYYPLIQKGDESLGKKDKYNYPEIIKPDSCTKYGAVEFLIGGINKCITCGTYEYFNGSDSCISVYNLDDACNMCPIDKHYNVNTGSCDNCRADQEWNSDKNECQCPEGWVENNSHTACVCENNGIYYAGWGCVSCTDVGAYPQNNKCVCNEVPEVGPYIEYDYDPFLMGEKCNRCVEKGQLANEDGECVSCMSNKIANNDNTACVCHVTTKENPTPSADSPDCICKLPEMKMEIVDGAFNTYCSCPGGSNHVYNEAKNKCECINSTVYYEATSGSETISLCVYCPHGVNVDGLCGCPNEKEIFDVVEGKCIVDCGAKGLIYDYETKKCICPEGTELKSGTADICICEDTNKIFQNGSCISCPSDANPDVDNATCDCGSGKKYDASTHTCLSACPIDSTEFENTCVCKDMSKIYNVSKNECVACPSDADKNGDTCICKDKAKIYDEENNTCIVLSCPIGSIVEIKTAEDLNLLSLCSNYKAGWTTEDKTFSLQNDIDMTDYKNFKPILDFKGVFNGNGKKISNLTINVPEEENVGMFGTVIFNGTSLISEVSLDNFNINGKNNVGSLIGMAEYNHTGAAVTGISYITINTEQPSNKIISTGGVQSCTGGLIGKITSTTSKYFMIKDIDITHNIDAASAGYKGGLIGCADVESGSLRLQNTNTSNVDFINKGTDAQIGGLIGHRTKTNTPQVSSATKNNIYACKWGNWLGGGTPISESYKTTHINCINK